jgi:hypothetical protein
MVANPFKNIMLLPGIALWAAIVFFSVLLSHNAILYFTHGGEYGILPEKLIARNDLMWNISFYVHLPTGIVCLLTPWYLFARRILKAARSYHSLVGKVYVSCTLLLVCPTGMYLALYAKGGFITQVGFMVQGMLLGYFTWRGYIAMKTSNLSQHIENMIRSYAVATVVLSFRILHILFFLLNVPYHDNYAISQWLGLSFNMLLAEIIIAFIPLKNHINQFKLSSL